MVSGTLAISASATDNKAVTSFTLSIDGDEAASAASGTLNHSWDTTAESNAGHVLVFRAQDAAGNSATQTERQRGQRRWRRWRQRHCEWRGLYA